MYLATVTCNRDFQQMLLQAESIQKFVEPCKHVVIVNEDKFDYDFWLRWLAPYYTNHELVLMGKIKSNYVDHFFGSYKDYGIIDNDSNGWLTQQLQKMLLAYEFNDDYLILDSKNFFIRPTSINEWDGIIGSGIIQSKEVLEDTYFKKSADTYEKYLGWSIDKFLTTLTPFKIKREPLVTKCKISELGYLLYSPEFNNAGTSEFIFYSFFVQEEIKNIQPPQTINQRSFLGNQYLNDLPVALFNLSTLQKNETIKISGFHKQLLTNANIKDFKIINYWLSTIGFHNKLYPAPRLY